MKAISPTDAKFSTKEAKTFTELENPLVGYKLLQLDVTGNDSVEIKIVMEQIK